MGKFIDTRDRREALSKRLREQMSFIRSACERGKTGEALRRSLELEETAERLTLLARNLPAYTGHPLAGTAVEKQIRSCIPVEIGFTAEGWFSVRFPVLLPKKETGSPEYVRGFLYPAMARFFAGRPPVRYANCVLVYRHVYDRTRPERRMRDHDNIEVNMVSDIIALYVLPDDGPAVCSHYACSAAGPEDRTEVYAVPQAEFPLWLMSEKTMRPEGVCLSEKREKTRPKT